MAELFNKCADCNRELRSSKTGVLGSSYMYCLRDHIKHMRDPVYRDLVLKAHGHYTRFKLNTDLVAKRKQK